MKEKGQFKKFNMDNPPKKSKFWPMHTYQIEIFYILVLNVGEIDLLGQKEKAFSAILGPI